MSGSLPTGFLALPSTGEASSLAQLQRKLELLVLHRLLTHEVPYPHENPNTVAASHLSAPVPRVDRSGLPPRIEELVFRMLAKDPETRPEIDEVIHTLSMLS